MGSFDSPSIVDRFRSMTEGGSVVGSWCLVRWMAGVTQMVLLARGGKDAECGESLDTSGATFCGPLSLAPEKYFESGGALGVLGFPSGEVGDVMLFASESEAAEFAELKGDHISIDLPCPLAELRFSVRVYDHYDGKAEIVYDGPDYQRARLPALSAAANLPRPG